MRPLIKRIRWVRIGCLLCGIMAAGAVGFGYYRDTTTAQLVEYRKTVEAGDTLWGIVGQVATNREDMSRLTWQVAQDNKIADPGNLQPGTELVIRVKKAREL
jgi:hypothetical protein